MPNPLGKAAGNGCLRISGGTSADGLVPAYCPGTWAADESAFAELIARALKEDGPSLIGCRIDSEKPKGMTERDPVKIRLAFEQGMAVKK